MRFLAKECNYSKSSLKRVICPNLRKENPNDINPQIKQVYREISNKPDTQNTRRACIVDDVRRIIKETPDYHPSKAEEASLWLFSLYTGARAISAVNVRLSDMRYYQDSEQIFISVNLRVTKGCQSWNHSVQISKDESVPVELDFFSWLDLHLRVSHNSRVQLLDGVAGQNKKLWHWSANAAREIFSARVFQTGYPRHFFSYHSLRAGFLCSALLKAASSEQVD